MSFAEKKEHSRIPGPSGNFFTTLLGKLHAKRK